MPQESARSGRRVHLAWLHKWYALVVRGGVCTPQKCGTWIVIEQNFSEKRYRRLIYLNMMFAVYECTKKYNVPKRDDG